VAPPDADVETLKALVDLRGGREALTELRQGITGIIQEASQHASLIAAGGSFTSRWGQTEFLVS